MKATAAMIAAPPSMRERLTREPLGLGEFFPTGGSGMGIPSSGASSGV